MLLRARGAAGSERAPLRTNFPEFLDDVGIPEGADGEQKETGVGDCICEDDSYCIQTLGRLVVDVAANTSNVILAEVWVPGNDGTR